MLCGARCFVKENLATDRLEAWGPLASREKAGWAARSGSSEKIRPGRALRARTRRGTSPSVDSPSIGRLMDSRVLK